VPRKLNPEISPKLSKLIMELLAKDPKDRPPSAHEVVNLLEEAEKEPAREYTEMLDEPAPYVQTVRGVADATIRGRAYEEDELDEQPPKRSLMLPLLIGGGVGVFALLLIGIITAVVLLKKNDTPEVAQTNDPPIQNTTPVQQPINPNPPVVNPVPPKDNPLKNVNPGDNNPPENPVDNPGRITRPGRRPPRTKKSDAREADKTYKPYSSAVKGLLFAPEGKHFFSFAERNARIDYWELETGKILHPFSLGGNVRQFMISSDGSRLLAYNAGHFACWDVEGGQPLVTLTPLPGTSFVGGGFSADKDVRAALSGKVPGGSIVVIYDHAIGSILPLIDPKSKKPVIDRKTRKAAWRQFPHPNTEVERVFFSPDGKRFLSWCKDRTFRTWDIEQPTMPITTSTVAPGEAKSLAVSKDFKRLLGAFGQPDFRVYDVEAGTEVKEIKPEGVGSTDALAFGGESNVGVAARFGGNTRIYDLEEGTIKKEVKGIAFTTAIALAPDTAGPRRYAAPATDTDKLSAAGAGVCQHQ
jgi:hypothetical protein